VDQAAAVDQTDYARVFRPNRSLSPQGRLICLLLFAMTSTGVAGAALFVGAWPVLPFAGLEIAVLCWAFYAIAAGDDDFEEFSVAGDEVRFDACTRKMRISVRGNRRWMRIEQVVEGGRCRLRLRYAGRSYPLGALLSDDQRASWAKELSALVCVERGGSGQGQR
jgi:uncharacterized membrane protein